MDDIALLGELGPHGLAAETEAFARLTQDEKVVVLTRLKALHAYHELKKPTSKEAARFASSIGMGRTNFMRLLSRTRSYGPVAALSGRRHLDKRPSVVRAGFSEGVEAVLAKTLAAYPEAPLSMVMSALRDSVPPSDLPHPSSVRRRLSEVRQAGAEGPTAAALMRPNPVFGRVMLAGSTISDVMLETDAQGPSARSGPCHVGLVVDVDTRLVVGAGLSMDRDDALVGAMYDVERFRWTMTIDDAPFAGENPDGPAGRLAYHHADLDGVLLGKVPVTGNPYVLVEVAPQILYRLIGTRLGKIALSSDTRDRTKPRAPFSRTAARTFVRDEVDRWNYLILCARAGLRPEGGADLVSRRMYEWSRLPAFDTTPFREYVGSSEVSGEPAAVHLIDHQQSGSPGTNVAQCLGSSIAP